MTINGLGFAVVAVLGFIVVLAPLVMVHEFGHFITARLRGIRVLEFGIGFPPRAKVIGHDHETEYTLNYLPIGGFVRLEGEESDSEDPRSFQNASLFSQLIVLAAGVVMNVLTAFVLFFVVAWLFNPVVRPQVNDVVAGSPAEAAGIKAGDSIVSIDGRQYSLIDLGGDPWSAFQEYLASRAGQPVTLVVADSAGQERSVVAQLRVKDTEHPYVLGVNWRFGVAYVAGDPVSAFGTAVNSTQKSMTLVVGAIGDLGKSIATNPTSGPTGVAGPVGIASAVAHTLFDYGPILLLLLAAVISANLALINILPFPPFDGGKMVVMIIKRVFRIRDITPVENLIYLVGFVLLMAFVVWISYFDIMRLGAGG